MEPEAPPAGLLQRIKRSLRPARRRFEYERRVFLSWAFRQSVDLLRLLGILPKPARAGAPMHLLIANLTPHLGDTIMQIPLIEALRAAHPEARIDYAVEQSAAPLLRAMPGLNHVYALKLGSIPPVGFWPSVERVIAVAREYWKLMRSCAPTVCLLPRWGDDLFRSSVLAYLTGAPRRIGFTWSVVTGAVPAPYRNAFLTDALPGGSGQHEPVRFCLLAADAGLAPPTAAEGLSTRVVSSLQSIAAIQDWPCLAERLGLNTNVPFVVIAPGASHPKRMWPLERWAEVMAALQAQGISVVLLTGAADGDVASALYRLTGEWAHLIAGRTSLVESLTLIAHAAAFLGNDSGPAHVAGALGVPTVTLFIATPHADPDGPSSPERIRPIGPSVICCRPIESLPPCVNLCMAETSHCIGRIAAAEVIVAIGDLFRAHELRFRGMADVR